MGKKEPSGALERKSQARLWKEKTKPGSRNEEPSQALARAGPGLKSKADKKNPLGFTAFLAFPALKTRGMREAEAGRDLPDKGRTNESV